MVDGKWQLENINISNPLLSMSKFRLALLRFIIATTELVASGS